MVSHKGPELPEQSSGFSQSKILHAYSSLLLAERTLCDECASAPQGCVRGTAERAKHKRVLQH